MTQTRTNSHPLQSRSEIELLRRANQRISSHLGWLAGEIKARAAIVAGGPTTLAREEVTALLEETAAKIFGVEYLHRRLAEHHSQQDVELSDYLADVCSALISSLALDSRVSVMNRTTSKCMASSERAQTIGLMAGEILMNAVKYAHPTGIPVRFTIECRSHGDGGIVLSLRDDGVGLPEGMDGSSQGGTGFRVIRSLESSLAAHLRIESDPLGLSFVLEFPSEAQAIKEVTGSAANVYKFPK